MNELDPATFVTAVGAALGGVALVIGAITGLWTSIKNTKIIKATAEQIELIDHAVNGQPEGAQTMQSKVSEIHAELPPIPEEINGVPIRVMMRLLVADMYDRRQTAGERHSKS